MAWGKVKIRNDILADIDRQIQETQKELDRAEKKGNDPKSVKMVLEKCVHVLKKDTDILDKRARQL
jgi:hypothetical protein